MKNIKIDNLKKSNNNFYILAETGFSHEGDIKYLKNQVKEAKKGKAEGIKFQVLINYKNVYTKDSKFYQILKKWVLTKEEWMEIFQYTKSLNLDLIVLPIDLSSIDFVKKNIEYIDAIEIHSTCLNEIPFLTKINLIPKPVILGIGGRDKDDIHFVIEFFKNSNNKNKKFILMFGFQSFPTDFHQLNLLKIKGLSEKFNFIIGYADHTSYEYYKKGNEIINYAYLLGARIFEKHIILEKGKMRIDYESALTHREFLELRDSIDDFQEILGTKNLNERNLAEKKYKNREKQIVYNDNFQKGHVIKLTDVAYKMTDQKSDFKQRELNLILNKTITKEVKKDHVIKKDHIQ